MRLREGGQGWTDSRILMAMALLNLTGEESVSDLGVVQAADLAPFILLTLHSNGAYNTQLEISWHMQY